MKRDDTRMECLINHSMTILQEIVKKEAGGFYPEDIEEIARWGWNPVELARDAMTGEGLTTTDEQGTLARHAIDKWLYDYAIQRSREVNAWAYSDE